MSVFNNSMNFLIQGLVIMAFVVVSSTAGIVAYSIIEKRMAKKNAKLQKLA